MKTELYYFTSTGNSLVTARELSKYLKGAKLISIPRAVRNKISSTADVIGIIFPVYIWGLPLIITDFIKKLYVADKKKMPYIFAVATYGGMPGTSLLRLAGQLKKKGLKLSGGLGVRMPGNYTPLYGAQSRDYQNNLFKKMKIEVKKIAEYVKTGKTGKMIKSNPFINLFLGTFLYNMAAPHIKDMDRKFWTDDNCNSCGICYKVCPKKNIKLVNKKPTWLHHCENCLGCLQWCPKEAIQFEKSTLGRKRYHHPEIKLKDVIMN